MTLTNTRAAFEQSITDAVRDLDPTVNMLYDNIPYTLAGKTKKYIATSITFNQATIQAQGSSSDFFTGTVQCNIYVPKSKGTKELSNLSEAVIDGLTAVNNSTYVDKYNCKPRVLEVSGPIITELEQDSHCLGIISCQFSANS